MCFFLKYQSLIRRGGVPSGAAAHIIFGGMGVLTPIINSGMKPFLWEIIRNYLTLPELCPPLGVPVAIALHYLFTKGYGTHEFRKCRAIACAMSP